MSCQQEQSTALNQALAVANALKQQNEELNSAFAEFKKEYIALDDEIINLRKQYQHEIDTKKTLQIDCHNLYKKWNDELKIQAQEFEKIQSEMIPNTELELLRVKVLEELEVSYSKKVDWIKNEMDKYQKLYSDTLCELQITKVNQQNTLNSVEETLNQKQHTLNHEIMKLKQENETLKQENMHNDIDVHISLKQEMQGIKTQNMEYNQQIQCLQKQITLLNQQNSTLNIENEEMKCLNISQIKELEGQVLIKSTEYNGLKQRYNDIEKEFETIKQQHLSKQHRLQKLENDQNHLLQQMEQKKQEILNLNESFSKKEKNIFQNNDKETHLLNDKIENLENDIESLGREKEKLNTEIHKSNNEHLIKTQQIKQQHFASFNNLFESKQEVDKQYQSVKCKLNELQNQNEKEIDLLKNNLEKERARTQQMKREKENISEINTNKDREIQDLLNDIQCLKNENTEITGEYQALTNKHRAILDINYELTSKETKYVTQIQYLESDIHDINKRIDAKIKAMNANKSENETCLNKLRKEKSKYKKLATATKAKVNALSKELMNIKKRKEFQITNLNKQIYQIERERDEIKFRLTMDSTNTNHDTDLITNNVDILLKELQFEQNEINNDT